jgi:peptide/nickel transport system substrate-binding protein
LTQRDRGVIAALSALLVVLALALTIPAAAPATAATGQRPVRVPASAEQARAAADLPRRRGGQPQLDHPADCPDPGRPRPEPARVLGPRCPGQRRDLRARPGLVVDRRRDGRTWTFSLRAGRRWQDGQPVTADDVVFTVGLLKDPAYRGQALANSWREVSVARSMPMTVQFSLATPIAGFLEDALVGILPRHLLAGVPVADLADSTFSNQPVGSGPFRLVHWDATSADLSPATTAVPQPALPGIEMRFFSTGALATAYRPARWTPRWGLPRPTRLPWPDCPGRAC